jgi:multiple sugar transport system permease protein
LLLPYLAGSAVLVLLPALATMGIAFTSYNAIQPPVWVGLGNFQRLFETSLIRVSLRNSLIFLALAVPFRLLASLVLSLLLQTDRKCFGWYRTAVFVPAVIPEAAFALVWLWILNPVHGPLNLLLQSIGLPAPAWLVEPSTARLAIVILSVFQTGEGFVLLLVGLQTVPPAVYDAARVDGASGWQSFRRITLPSLVPWLLLLVFRDLVVSLQNTFTPSFVLTYGGPYYATTFVPLLIYELAFDFFDLGLAAAVIVLVFGVIGLLVVGVLNLVGLRGGEDG